MISYGYYKNTTSDKDIQNQFDKFNDENILHTAFISGEEDILQILKEVIKEEYSK